MKAHQFTPPSDEQLVQLFRSALRTADADFVEDFVTNGFVTKEQVPGGRDGGFRYLLAAALHEIDAQKLALVTGVSEAAARCLKDWLVAGTHV
jgi:hypothetical protein